MSYHIYQINNETGKVVLKHKNGQLIELEKPDMDRLDWHVKFHESKWAVNELKDIAKKQKIKTAMFLLKIGVAAVMVFHPPSRHAMLPLLLIEAYIKFKEL